MVLLNFSAILAGISAVSFQIIIIREFLASFYGSEISVSIALFLWLALTAAGSFAAGLLMRKKTTGASFVAAAFLLEALFIPAAVLLAGWARTIHGVPPGGIISFAGIFVSEAAVLAPFCLVSGVLFVFLSSTSAGGIARPAERIYMLDTLGMAVGGILTGMFLVRVLPHPAITVMLSAVCFMVSALWARGRKVLIAAVAACAAIFALLWFFGIPEGVLSKSRDAAYEGYRVLSSCDGIYGRMTAVARGNQVSIFSDGALVFSSPDPQTTEERVHFAMLEDSRPEKVLLIGAACLPSLGEVMKYHGTRATLVELDGELTSVSLSAVPDAWKYLSSGRAKIINSDPVAFLSGSREKYDCVIMEEGIPYSARVNRFYTSEFFSCVRRVMKYDGVFSFSLPSSESYISPPLAAFLNSIKKTVASVFKNVAVVPGETAYFLASPSQTLTLDHVVLDSRAGARGVSLKYVTAPFLKPRMNSAMTGWMSKSLASASDARENSILRPRAYYYGLVYLSGHFRDSLTGRILSFSERKPFVIFFIFIAAALLIFMHSLKHRQTAAVFAMSAAGFSGAVFQLLVLVYYQSVAGALYYNIGALTALFMTGMAAGCLVSSTRERDGMKLFSIGAAAISLFSFAAAILARETSGNIPALTHFFYVLPALAGFLGGFHFPQALRVIGARPGVGFSAGSTYSADLAGSCLGALAVSVVLVPVFGFAGALVLTGLIALIAFAGLFSYNFRRRNL